MRFTTLFYTIFSGLFVVFYHIILVFFLCAHLLEVGLYDILKSNNLPDGRNGAAYAVEYII